MFAERAKDLHERERVPAGREAGRALPEAFLEGADPHGHGLGMVAAVPQALGRFFEQPSGDAARIARVAQFGRKDVRMADRPDAYWLGAQVFPADLAPPPLAFDAAVDL